MWPSQSGDIRCNMLLGICLNVRWKRNSSLRLFYWFLPFYKTCSESSTIFAPLCSAYFKAFCKETTSLWFCLCWIACIAELWPLIFITLYQVEERGLEWLTFTTLYSSFHHCRGSQNSHMPVSRATSQDPCPERVDRQWMEEHEPHKNLLLFLVCNIIYRTAIKAFSFMSIITVAV